MAAPLLLGGVEGWLEIVWANEWEGWSVINREGAETEEFLESEVDLEDD